MDICVPAIMIHSACLCVCVSESVGDDEQYLNYGLNIVHLHHLWVYSTATCRSSRRLNLVY